LNLNVYVPAALIVDQLGPTHAQMILNAETYRSTRRPLAWLTHGAAKMVVRGYYLVRRRVLQYVPVVGSVVGDVTSKSADMLIDSWRDSFRRKPFYVPANATTWVPDRTVTPEYEAHLMQWRQRFFNTMAAGLASIVLAGVASVAAVVLFLLDLHVPRNTAAIVAVAAALLGLTLLNVTVPALAKERPKLE
jgi:hypothetical protein